MHSVTVVGFGNIGSRHVQSLLAAGDYRVKVVEPSEENYKAGLARIGASEDQLRYASSLEELKEAPELAILATTASRRLACFEALVALGTRRLLLEKILFPDLTSFDRAIDLCEAQQVQTACNFVMRTMPVITELRQRLADRSQPVQVTFSAGDFGLATTGIHYLDLLEYFLDSPISIEAAQLERNETDKRRAGYLDFRGELSGRSERGDRFFMRLAQDVHPACTMAVSVGDTQYAIHFEEEYYLTLNREGAHSGACPFPHVSLCTHGQVQALLGGDCCLPTIAQSRNAHNELFRVCREFLPELGADEALPIT